MKNNSKYLIILVMLYTAVAMADLVLIYRMSIVGGLAITAGVYVMPIYYFLEDIIAELYGYARVRQVIWSVQISAVVFSLIVTIAINLPTPNNWHYSGDYHFVFAHLFRTILGGGLVAMIGGAFFNGYLLSRWKIIFHGRYFLLRSIGSSAVGQMIQTVVGCFLLYFSVLPFTEILKMILPIYLIQLVGCAIIAVPGSMLVSYLKNSEGIDFYDHNINYNPFRLS